jgi:hypothetical protein
MRKVCGLNIKQLRAGRKPGWGKSGTSTDKSDRNDSTSINVSDDVLANTQMEEVPVDVSVPEM